MQLHWHHIIPKHAGGTDDPSNLVQLTIEDHAIAHKVLYGLWKREEDRIAWQGLIGIIDHKEAVYQSLVLAGKSLTGKPKTPEHNLKNSLSKLGKPLKDHQLNAIRDFNIKTKKGVKLKESHKQAVIKNLVSPKSGSFKWYTNGSISIQVKTGESIPEGFHRGRLKC